MRTGAVPAASDEREAVRATARLVRVHARAVGPGGLGRRGVPAARARTAKMDFIVM